mmetsp:Transcript_22743/g.47938  ORF Transcript_22743/g.47938 Transcript_22743/m.47938 type:complete len:169 (-) Transcript_22743:104-610(-)
MLPRAERLSSLLSSRAEVVRPGVGADSGRSSEIRMLLFWLLSLYCESDPRWMATASRDATSSSSWVIAEQLLKLVLKRSGLSSHIMHSSCVPSLTKVHLLHAQVDAILRVWSGSISIFLSGQSTMGGQQWNTSFYVMCFTCTCEVTSPIGLRPETRGTIQHQINAIAT